MDLIAEGTRICGDPGLQYDSTINRWHTCPNSGPINASNPCSEYMFIDDSACNLASLNLMKFRKEDGTFDVEGFKKAIRLFIIAQEILVDNGSYPDEPITENSHKFRPLGLGYANLGVLMMSLALPYDSEQARAWAAAITRDYDRHGLYGQVPKLARIKGPFDEFSKNAERDAQGHQYAPRARLQYFQNRSARIISSTPPRMSGMRRSTRGTKTRLPQRPGHGACPDRHNRLYDGLRYNRHRAGYRAGEI